MVYCAEAAFTGECLDSFAHRKHVNTIPKDYRMAIARTEDIIMPCLPTSDSP